MHVVGFDIVSFAFGAFCGIFFFMLGLVLAALKNKGGKR